MAQVKATTKSAGAIAALVLAAAAFTAPKEGLVTVAYRDLGGVWTICNGETQGVTQGMKKTPSECAALLQKRIPDYMVPVIRKLPGDTPDNRIVAYTDFAYNAGVGAFERSPIPALEQAGKPLEACRALLTLRTTVKGVEVRGLKNRRKQEYDLCVKNLS